MIRHGKPGRNAEIQKYFFMNLLRKYIFMTDSFFKDFLVINYQNMPQDLWIKKYALFPQADILNRKNNR